MVKGRTNNFHTNYQKVQIETARKETLITMLMEGAIRFLLLARNKTVDNDNDLWSYRVHVLKAESMLLELLASLNFEQGGQIAVSLQQLYLYMIDLLSQVLEEKGKQEKIDEVIGLLIPLKDTWVEASKKYVEEEMGSRAASCSVRA